MAIEATMKNYVRRPNEDGDEDDVAVWVDFKFWAGRPATRDYPKEGAEAAVTAVQTVDGNKAVDLTIDEECILADAAVWYMEENGY